jgi:acetyl esterase/lipase
MDLAAQRDMLEEFHAAGREPAGVSYAEVNAGGVPALWCIPEGCAADRVLLYFHGGGFVFNTMHSHRKLAGHLAKAAGVRALVPDYRRAPEHPFPAQLDDSVAVYRWLLESGIAAQHIATAGDSAGGNLCLALVLKLRDEGEALPAAILPISPWVDVELSGDGLEARSTTDVLVNRRTLEALRTMYLAGERWDHPLASLLRADLTGLPPLLIEAGDDEVLADDSVRLAAAAEKAGVEASFHLAPGMQHVFPCLAGRAPEADEAIARMGHWLRPKLHLP